MDNPIAVEFDYVNRQKRLWTRVTEIVFIGIIIFFYLCLRVKNGSTIVEEIFGVEKYWRTIGWFGIPTSFVLFLIIRQLTKFKNGKIILGSDKIELMIKGRQTTFYISQIDSMTVTKDIPHEDDSRFGSQKASRLTFSIDNRTYDLELSTPNNRDFDNLRPILKHWKDQLKGYKETYR
ncbi:hypothetical protein QQ020_07745 [Fulvivirgaceae bacterium BMA12]|uniref:Uncharacterized protein n=1 Tax=Agaribacillus aureus TaxID=3051825 RepID=A0ABT8L2H1_9BACT|nr:hypothetical protein [Fulvivirgaceae bacterium BMA12]